MAKEMEVILMPNTQPPPRPRKSTEEGLSDKKTTFVYTESLANYLIIHVGK
jgi:hypothetical protein